MIATRFEIEIIYNGVVRPLEVTVHERIAELLAKAVHLFAITSGAHLLSLFRTDGTKVDDRGTVESAHLTSGEELLLRPDVVKGG